MECPICFKGIHESWETIHSHKPYGRIDSENIIYVFEMMNCPECSNDLVKFSGFDSKQAIVKKGFLIPLIQKRKPLPEYIPEKYVKLYDESTSILTLSPMASAALSRTCLQLLLREYGKVEPGNLFDEIQQVIDSKHLPPELEQTIDIIRQNGNNATHPSKNTNPSEIIPLDLDEAEWGLEILDSLFEHYITRPYIQKEKLDKFAKKHSK